MQLRLKAEEVSPVTFDQGSGCDGHLTIAMGRKKRVTAAKCQEKGLVVCTDGQNVMRLLFTYTHKLKKKKGTLLLYILNVRCVKGMKHAPPWHTISVENMAGAVIQN